MTLTLCAAAVSDRGLVRTNNEDSAFAGRHLIAVADGIGGLPAGELASDIVIKTLAPLDAAADVEDPLLALRAAAARANTAIQAESDADPAHEGLGTTLTALLLTTDGQLGLLHIGDSRCYRERDGVMEQITRDDTYVQSLVDQGLLTRDEARRHPRRSLVTQALHGQPAAPTCAYVAYESNDRYLICSDGLSDYVVDAAIGQVLRQTRDPKECGERLVELALDAGAPDNVTVVVADLVVS